MKIDQFVALCGLVQTLKKNGVLCLEQAHGITLDTRFGTPDYPLEDAHAELVFQCQRLTSAWPEVQAPLTAFLREAHAMAVTMADTELAADLAQLYFLVAAADPL